MRHLFYKSLLGHWLDLVTNCEVTSREVEEQGLGNVGKKSEQSQAGECELCLAGLGPSLLMWSEIKDGCPSCG